MAGFRRVMQDMTRGSNRPSGIMWQEIYWEKHSSICYEANSGKTKRAFVSVCNYFRRLKRYGPKLHFVEAAATSVPASADEVKKRWERKVVGEGRKASRALTCERLINVSHCRKPIWGVKKTIQAGRNKNTWTIFYREVYESRLAWYMCIAL